MLKLGNTLGEIFSKMAMTIAIVASVRYVLKDDMLIDVNIKSNLDLQATRRYL